MSRNIKVKIEITKTVEVTIRKKDSGTLSWDWFTEDGIESSEYYGSIEEAIDDAEKVLSA